MKILYNVLDRRNMWIGPWKVEPLYINELTEADIGRTVIYNDGTVIEAGTLSSWRDNFVFVRYSQGDTAAATDPARLVFGIEQTKE